MSRTAGQGAPSVWDSLTFFFASQGIWVSGFPGVSGNASLTLPDDLPEVSMEIKYEGLGWIYGKDPMPGNASHTLTYRIFYISKAVPAP